MVKLLFSDKSSNKSKITLVENENIITDNYRIAEIMNEYFVNIKNDLNIPDIETEKLPENLNNLTVDPIDEIIHKYSKHPSINKIREFVHFTVLFSFDKTNDILELNSNKAPGPDNIPTKVLKSSINVIKSPLTLLFNSCVDECHFPCDLKHADVTPLLKKVCSTDKENYRPISILPSISKLYERQMFRQISSFVSKNLFPYLCGFRKGLALSMLF